MVGPAAPSSALPVGQKSMVDPLRLMSIMPSQDLVHSVLAVIHAQSADDILTGNVAGFVQVYVLCPPSVFPALGKMGMRPDDEWYSYCVCG